MFYFYDSLKLDTIPHLQEDPRPPQGPAVRHRWLARQLSRPQPDREPLELDEGPATVDQHHVCPDAAGRVEASVGSAHTAGLPAETIRLDGEPAAAGDRCGGEYD